MSYRSERRRSRVGCLAWLVALVWVAVLAIFGYRYFLAPQVSQLLGAQINSKIGAAAPSPIAGQTPAPQAEVEQRASGALPTVVAGLPSGELHITEAQINSYLASQADALKPLDSATVQLIPGELQVAVKALGLSSIIHTGLAVQDGRVIAVNPRIDGPLGSLINAGDLAQTLETNLNNQLSAQGRRISDVRIEQGELVVTIQN
jgi:hypothetical protein